VDRLVVVWIHASSQASFPHVSKCDHHRYACCSTARRGAN
jgi:hypothetical protein